MNATTSTRSLKTGLNELFREFIGKYKLDQKYTEVFKEQMKLTISRNEKEQIRDEKILRRELSVLDFKFNKLNDKYIYHGLDGSIYENQKTILESQKIRLSEEYSKFNKKISNLDEKIESCSLIAQNINKY